MIQYDTNKLESSYNLINEHDSQNIILCRCDRLSFVKISQQQLSFSIKTLIFNSCGMN